MTAVTSEIGQLTAETAAEYAGRVHPPTPFAVRAVATKSLAQERASTLLENLRRAPMLRHRTLDEPKRMLRGRIHTALEEQGVLPRLAARIALQFVLKQPATRVTAR